ncbi:MAG: ribosome small subunit-dependent GTPase A [Firmicutes bacterium]|nr:ribosome small subunit-dependent GTPase A [Bacillota bacterium]
MEGQIVKIISDLYSVKIGKDIYECKARGKFRNERITPVVGDRCIIDCKESVINEILPRKNSMERPLIANVDIAVIVTSVKKPDLSLNLLDKMISLVTINNIQPIICFTKLDLANKEELKEIKKLTKYYNSIGIKTTNNIKYKKLCKMLKKKIVVFTGQTGAGKSSLLNRIDNKLNLKTDEISEALGRGKHTTRHVELFEIKKMLIADTPGFSALDFRDISKEAIKNSFIEFKNSNCKFNDCNHINEKECEVKEKVKNNIILKSRYDNYINFVSK